MHTYFAHNMGRTLEWEGEVGGEVDANLHRLRVEEGGHQNGPEEAARAIVQQLPVQVVVQAAPGLALLPAPMTPLCRSHPSAAMGLAT